MQKICFKFLEIRKYGFSARTVKRILLDLGATAYLLSEAVSLDNRWSPAVAETLRDMYTSRHVFVRTGYNFSCGSAHVFGSVSLGVLLVAFVK
jgi:high-affinity nickel permease